jgi:hypothetical protein
LTGAGSGILKAPVASDGRSTIVTASAALLLLFFAASVPPKLFGVFRTAPHLRQNFAYAEFWVWQCPQITMCSEYVRSARQGKVLNVGSDETLRGGLKELGRWKTIC